MARKGIRNKVEWKKLLGLLRAGVSAEEGSKKMGWFDPKKKDPSKRYRAVRWVARHKGVKDPETGKLVIIKDKSKKSAA